MKLLQMKLKLIQFVQSICFNIQIIALFDKKFISNDVHSLISILYVFYHFSINDFIPIFDIQRKRLVIHLL